MRDLYTVTSCVKLLRGLRRTRMHHTHTAARLDTNIACCYANAAEIGQVVGRAPGR